MKKHITIISIIAIMLSVTACNINTDTSLSSNRHIDEAGIVSAHGQLRVEGADIVDKNGNHYQLRGMSTHGIQWYPQFINKDAIKELRDDWNINVLRLALYSSNTFRDTSDTKEEMERYVDEGVQICIDLDMYVIIDWHVLADKTPLTNKESAIEFFNKFSKKYKNIPNVIFEICNEPNPPATWDNDIKPYAEEIIPLIRKNSPNAIIIVGTAQWSQSIDEPLYDPLKFNNIMYTFHFYAGSHGDWLRNSVTRCYEAGLPIFVTEFGMCESDGRGINNFEETQKWLNLLDEYNISYINWNLSNKNETSAVLNPGSSALGGWSENDFSEGGAWIRDWFRSRG